MTATGFDHDVVVVGSGFGGAVSALRLAEKGYDVHVYEAGRRFEDEDFARTSWDLRRYLWAPRLGCFGVQRIHRLPDVVLLAGAGVGGGSLNYANTLYVPPAAFFRDPQWRDITDWQAELAPHYATASRMLGVVTNPCDGPVEQVMRRAADDLGVGDTFRRTPVGVFFGPPGGAGDRPLLRRRRARAHRLHRVRQLHGRLPGRAPRTRWSRTTSPWPRTSGVVDRADAHGDRGAAGRPGPAGARGYRVTTEATGAWRRKDRRTVRRARWCWPRGTWGTQRLLHTMRVRGAAAPVATARATSPAPTPRRSAAR